jgi:hypothetical protein
MRSWWCSATSSTGAATLALLQQAVPALWVLRITANSASVSLPGLFSTSSGISALPMSCSRPAWPATRQASSSRPMRRASATISAHTATECM